MEMKCQVKVSVKIWENVHQSDLKRKFIRDSILSVGNNKVSKGTRIFTPIFQMYRDTKIYGKPDKFEPEKFAEDNKNS